MFSRSNNPPAPKEDAQVIDRSKRFDVYVVEHQKGLVVFKNVRIVGRCSLFDSGNQYDVWDKFVELEQEDGTRVFVSRHGMVRLCEHGVAIKTEVIG